MQIDVRNDQREAPVAVAAMRRLARRAVVALKVRKTGRLAVTFIGSAPMRRLNRRFKHHDWATDVLCFRYDGRDGGRGTGDKRTHVPCPMSHVPVVVGEILISPKAAQAYAKRHRLAYREELSRYVVHGLLHWLGEEDGTAAQQRRMRQLEDRLLSRCAS